MNTQQDKSTNEALIFPLPDLELVQVKGLPEEKTFKMGGTGHKDEQPIHEVRIGNSFYMCKFQVTQQLYERVLGKNPSKFKGQRRPVERVSWEDTKVFFTALEALDIVKDFKEEKGMLHYEFRLPTEAEWEYAARGGVHSQGFKYCGSDHLKQVGWYRENSGLETKPVGLLLPNELGLYDMSGNVWEWCADDWHENYKGAPDDGRAWIDVPDRAADRVVRGGDYWIIADYCRLAFRFNGRPGFRYNSLGFRVVLAPVQEGIPPLSKTGRRA